MKKIINNIYDQLPKPFFILAPMDDVTDLTFRDIIASCSPPDLFFTEFVNVDGLQSPGRPKLLHKLKFKSDSIPIIAQIWGKTPDNFYKTATELVEMGFAGVDINMGCPDKTIVKNGCCAALINNRELAAEIIKATKEGINKKVPLSIKTRTGFNEVDTTWPEFLLKQGIDSLTIHGRTKKQLSDAPVDWNYINRTRQLRDELNLKTKIIGNGDVLNRQSGLEIADKYKLDGIMIGRGAFTDPFAFSSESPWPSFDTKQRKALYKRHIELFADTWKNNERNIQSLKKFCKLYINNFDGAKELREQLMRAKSASQLITLLS